MNNDCVKYKKINKNKKIKLIVCQIVLLFLFLIIWELLAYFGIINTFIFSKPSDILKLLIQYVQSKEIFKHIKISVIETILGIVIGSIVGIIIASILWYYEFMQKLLNPFLNVLNALPKTALAPIMIIWAGTGVKGIVVVAISILLIITILSTYNYFINVDKEKVKMLESFEATKFQIFTKLILPSNFFSELVNGFNCSMFFIIVVFRFFRLKSLILSSPVKFGVGVKKFEMVPTV